MLTMLISPKLGRQIRLERKKQKKTLVQIAERIGITHAWLSIIERKGGYVSWLVWSQLMKELGIDKD